MRHDHRSVHKEFIFDLNIFSSDSESINSDPLADCVLPPDYAALDEAIAVDLGSLHHSGIVDFLAWSNDNSSTNDNIGAELCGRVNFGRGVNKHIADKVLTLTEAFGLLLSQRLEEELLANEVVLGLSDVHPVAIKGIHEQVVVCSHLREYLSLDGCGFHFDAVNHRYVQQVETGIDLVAHPLLRLLNESLNLTVLLADDDAILGWVLHCGRKDRSLLAVSLVELNELLQGVVTDHIRVEDEEETCWVVLQDVLLGETDRSGGTHWLILDGDGNLHFVLNITQDRLDIFLHAVKDMHHRCNLLCPHKS